VRTPKTDRQAAAGPHYWPLAAALVLFAVVVWLLPLRELDLAVYWRAAQQVFVAGTEPYTRAEDAGLPFTYPPTALFLLQPLAGLTLAQAADLLWCLNLALAVLVMLLLPRDLAHMPVGAAFLPRPEPRSEPNHSDRGQRPLSQQARPVGAAFLPRPEPPAPQIAARRLRTWGPLYIACFGGLYLTLHFHQVNLLLLLCLWGFWRVLRLSRPGPPARGPGRLAAGAALALGSVAKPHYGLLLLGTLGCLRAGRRPGPGLWLLLGAVLGGVALLWASIAVAPAGSWAAWWAQVPGTTSFTALPPGHSSIAAPWNRSIAGEVARWLVPNKFTEPLVASPAAAGLITTALVLGLALATGRAVLASVLLRARRCTAGTGGADPVAVDLELSLLALWVFLAAPASWTHHLVLLLPAALVLLRDAVLDPRAGGLGRLAAVLVLAVLALTLDDLIPREVRTGSRAIMALMTVAVLGLWALLLERLLRHTAASRQDPAGAAPDLPSGAAPDVRAST